MFYGKLNSEGQKKQLSDFNRKLNTLKQTTSQFCHIFKLICLDILLKMRSMENRVYRKVFSQNNPPNIGSLNLIDGP